MNKRTYHCAECNGTNVSQQINAMIPLNRFWNEGWDIGKNLSFDWDDYYFCEDCYDEVHIYNKTIKETDDGN